MSEIFFKDGELKPQAQDGGEGGVVKASQTPVDQELSGGAELRDTSTDQDEAVEELEDLLSDRVEDKLRKVLQVIFSDEEDEEDTETLIETLERDDETIRCFPELIDTFADHQRVRETLQELELPANELLKLIEDAVNSLQRTDGLSADPEVSREEELTRTKEDTLEGVLAESQGLLDDFGEDKGQEIVLEHSQEEELEAVGLGAPHIEELNTHDSLELRVLETDDSSLQAFEGTQIPFEINLVALPKAGTRFQVKKDGIVKKRAPMGFAVYNKRVAACAKRIKLFSKEISDFSKKMDFKMNKLERQVMGLEKKRVPKI
jgi:hypothetical protein